MEPKRYLTSGEVAEILGVSRGTVSKRFDEGILDGKKNPITGKRLISPESLKDFMKRYDFEVHDIVFWQQVICHKANCQKSSDNCLYDLNIIGLSRAQPKCQIPITKGGKPCK